MEFGVFIGAHNLGDQRSEQQLFADMTDQAVLADQLGYDIVWLVEHHFNDYNLLPDPLQLAVRIFERTERIRVGVAVVILRDHHPLQLAGRIAQLDVLYPGRFELAVGRGSSGYEAVRFQREMDVDTSRAHFYEHLEVMVNAWRNDVDTGHEGRFWSFPPTTVLPRPVSKPHPSLWLSAVTPWSIYGQVENCRKLDVPAKVITSPFRNPFEYLAEGYAQFQRGLKEFGFEREDAQFAVNRTVFIGESEAEVDAAMTDVLRIHRGLYAQLEGNEVYLNGKTQIRPVEHEIGAEDVIANVPFGTPERVRDQVRPYHELGVDHLSLYFDYLSGHHRVIRAMKLFAAEVMPHFHDRPVRYGRERLDNLLDPRHRAPDFEEYVSRFETRSAEYRRRPGAALLDLAYGNHPRERLDVFAPPKASASLPVNVFYHGGYWRSSSKERYSFVAETFTSAGAACVVPEYALVPDVPFDELIRQCRAALAYLYEHASELDLDPGRIHVSGHSAGGEIVGMLMSEGWQQPLGLPYDVVRGGCGISGLYDMEPIRLSYLNDTLGLDRETARRNSPSLLRPASTGHLILAVGSLEGEEFLRQNALMKGAWGGAVEITPMIMEGAQHYSAVEALGDPESALAHAVLAQMGLT
jgi:arylformamidase